MNFKDNLKKIRKDNNLSQEELADKLGVSRQAVSKWESGLAYPEMDKVLQICKMFNLNIDDLLNKDIKEVNETKESKNIFNKYINDFTSYITKTIDVFSSMKFKEKFKCIFEQLLLIGIFTILFAIVGSVGEHILSSLFSFIHGNLYYILLGIFGSVYVFIAIFISAILLIQIFKVRYLNYYDIVITEDTKTDKETTIVKEEKEIKKEKIIIRDPEHTGYKFMSGIARVFILFVKFITIFIIFAFLVSLLSLVIGLVLSFLVLKSGLTFIGIFLCLISCIAVNVIILVVLYDFIINRKQKARLFGITFLISVIFFGIGLGVFTIGLKDFEYVKDLEKVSYQFEMSNDIIVDRYYWIEFHEEDRNDIKIEATYFKGENISISKSNNFIDVYYDFEYGEVVKDFIKNFNDKKILDIYDRKIDLYASRKNIDIIIKNTKNKRY